ncbi:N-acyl-D-amino-acid deacylase family protein [Zobellella maritima]|uniref:N-acyl-D-amino-acid deacylase family protein n=1 Tax=Zobellella maritima TaxID=2059725 RepID=UPI000E301324|nr:amidohydrolase family protein [Zobellella maritima]
MFDTIITNGLLIDGTGKAAGKADLGIRGEHIAAIGDLSSAQAKNYIDASGLIVSPGFIDIHTHSDFSLLVNGKAESQVHQGVTLEVVGNCGHSCAPCPKCDALKGSIFGYQSDIKMTWNTFDEYLTVLDEQPLGVNVAAYVGHGTLRIAAMDGNINRPATSREIKEMERLLAASLEEGAIGFSTGLEYSPGSSAPTSEITQLCKVLQQYDRLYATHVRNRDIYYEQGFGEALAVARNAGVRLQISHIAPKFGAPAHAMEHTLEMINWAREDGVDVAFDIIPHNWGPTTMSSILPPWAFDGGIAKILERLATPSLRAALKDNPNPIWQLIPAGRWDLIMLFQSNQNPGLIGMTISEIAAKRRESDPHDTVLNLLLEEGEGLFNMTWAANNFAEADNRLCVSQPECGIISDTITLAPYGALGNTRWSPSSYGWTSRFIEKYHRKDQLITLEDAVRRITGLAAERLGIQDRGVLRVGNIADITIFNSAEIHDNSTMQDPNRYPSGITHVLVNGKLTIHAGQRTHENAGRVLRPGA